MRPQQRKGGRGSRISNPPGLCDLRPCPPGQKKGCLVRSSRRPLLRDAARSSPYFLRKAVVMTAYKAPKSPEPELLRGSWIRIPSGSQNSLPDKKVLRNAQNLTLVQEARRSALASTHYPLAAKLSQVSPPLPFMPFVSGPLLDESPVFQLLSRIPATRRDVLILYSQGSLPGEGLGLEALGKHALDFLSVHNLQDNRNQARQVYGAGR